MSRDKKYDVSGLLEAQFEPGSRKLVLKNLLHVRKKAEMDKIEAVALKQAEDACYKIYDKSGYALYSSCSSGHNLLPRRGTRAKCICGYDKNYRFSANGICRIHKLWLGKIYAWAGNYRQVNISKGNAEVHDYCG